ncbi:hypothetical protein B0A49_06624 [Cryomyces minteri]|uniref:Uncharacterized protein n=1 Tax=Cryomyces minteri TaxID=331657 RepID=A0A4U0WZ06_9PEZI|nr:hypothetical protein B0A49_06624 [Cryomyces minteri]
MNHRDDLTGTDFGKGKTLKVQRDPWRGTSRAAFGDYVEEYKRQLPRSDGQGEDTEVKTVELNCYDDTSNPTHGYDIVAQRPSVYILRKESTASLPVDTDIKNPYGESVTAIIVFEHSQSGSVEDTLIGARQQIESRWRRLTFYLPRGQISSDDRMALQFEKPVYAHSDFIREMQGRMKDSADAEDPQADWLASTPDEFRKLLNLIQEDLVKPIMNLSDVIYRSVGIRDTRQSLQLGTSMWRLSWIAFIFPPLTFLSGFFGMNVSVFKDDPRIKWHFVSAIALMLLVLFLWYFVKHSLAARRQTPYERGIYEQVYNDFATQHPQL